MVIGVVGTRFSGKSMLCQLLASRFVADGDSAYYVSNDSTDWLINAAGLEFEAEENITEETEVDKLFVSPYGNGLYYSVLPSSVKDEETRKALILKIAEKYEDKKVLIDIDNFDEDVARSCTVVIYLLSTQNGAKERMLEYIEHVEPDHKFAFRHIFLIPQEDSVKSKRAKAINSILDKPTEQLITIGQKPIIKVPLLVTAKKLMLFGKYDRMVDMMQSKHYAVTEELKFTQQIIDVLYGRGGVKKR